MVKKGYYRNECFSLPWDCIKLHLTAQFYTTPNKMDALAEQLLRSLPETSLGLMQHLIWSSRWEQLRNIIRQLLSQRAP